MLSRAARRILRREVVSVLRRNAEHKYIQEFKAFVDTYLPPLVTNGITQYGVLWDLSSIDEGDSKFERTGNKATLTSLQMKLLISTWNNSDDDTECGNQFSLRVIIFTWLDDNTPITTDIIDDFQVGQTTRNFHNILCPLNSDYKRKRKLWWDKTYDMGVFANEGTNPVPGQKHIDIYIPLKTNNTVYYESEGFENSGLNKLWVLFISTATDNELNDYGSVWPVYAFFRTNFIDF